MVEIVSVGADETTDVSVVGKFPTAVPFAFTPGLDAAAGALVVDETTDESSVAKCPAALGAGAGEAATGEGELEGRAPSPPSGNVDATEGVPPFVDEAEVPFALSIAAC